MDVIVCTHVVPCGNTALILEDLKGLSPRDYNCKNSWTDALADIEGGSFVILDRGFNLVSWES